MSEIRGKCKGCGRILIIDKAKRISRHEAPTCKMYDDVVASSSATRIPDYHETPDEYKRRNSKGKN